MKNLPTEHTDAIIKILYKRAKSFSDEVILIKIQDEIQDGNNPSIEIKVKVNGLIQLNKEAKVRDRIIKEIHEYLSKKYRGFKIIVKFVAANIPKPLSPTEEDYNSIYKALEIVRPIPNDPVSILDQSRFQLFLSLTKSCRDETRLELAREFANLVPKLLWPSLSRLGEEIKHVSALNDYFTNLAGYAIHLSIKMIVLFQFFQKLTTVGKWNYGKHEIMFIERDFLQDIVFANYSTVTECLNKTEITNKNLETLSNLKSFLGKLHKTVESQKIQLNELLRKLEIFSIAYHNGKFFLELTDTGRRILFDDHYDGFAESFYAESKKQFQELRFNAEKFNAQIMNIFTAVNGALETVTAEYQSMKHALQIKHEQKHKSEKSVKKEIILFSDPTLSEKCAPAPPSVKIITQPKIIHPPIEDRTTFFSKQVAKDTLQRIENKQLKRSMRFNTSSSSCSDSDTAQLPEVSRIAIEVRGEKTVVELSDQFTVEKKRRCFSISPSLPKYFILNIGLVELDDSAYQILQNCEDRGWLKRKGYHRSGLKLVSTNIVGLKDATKGQRVIFVGLDIEEFKIFCPVAIVSHAEWEDMQNYCKEDASDQRSARLLQTRQEIKLSLLPPEETSHPQQLEISLHFK